MNFYNEFTKQWRSHFTRDEVPHVNCLKADQFKNVPDQMEALKRAERDVNTNVAVLQEKLSKQIFLRDHLVKYREKLSAIAAVLEQMDCSVVGLSFPECGSNDSEESKCQPNDQCAASAVNDAGATSKLNISSSEPQHRPQNHQFKTESTEEFHTFDTGPSVASSASHLSMSTISDSSTACTAPNCTAAGCTVNCTSCVSASCISCPPPPVSARHSGPVTVTAPSAPSAPSSASSSSSSSSSSGCPPNEPPVPSLMLDDNCSRSVGPPTPLCPLSHPPPPPQPPFPPHSTPDFHQPLPPLPPLPHLPPDTKVPPTSMSSASSVPTTAASSHHLPNFMAAALASAAAAAAANNSNSNDVKPQIPHGNFLFPKRRRYFACQVCGKRYSSKAAALIHMRTHTGERPFVCNECGRAFRQKAQLIQHERIHSGEKPYMCEVCEKSFRQKSHLDQHMHTHLTVKPFYCDKCGKAFRRKRGLLAHQERQICEGRVNDLSGLIEEVVPVECPEAPPSILCPPSVLCQPNINTGDDLNDCGLGNKSEGACGGLTDCGLNKSEAVFLLGE